MIRRPARASGDAVRKILRSASGKTTVPMSRPSTTTSRPARTMARSWVLTHSRTTGTADTAETQAGDRGRPGSRRPPARPRGRPRSPAPSGWSMRPRSSAARRMVSASSTASGSSCAPAAARRLAQRHQRHAAIERARVEMGEAERLGDRARRGGLARGRRAVDGDDAALHRTDPPGQAAQRLREAREAHRRARHVVHPDPGARHGAEHRERHGQPVIAGGPDRARAAARSPPSTCRSSPDTSARLPTDAQVLRDQAEPVALLHPELADLPEDRRALARATRARRAAGSRRSARGSRRPRPRWRGASPAARPDRPPARRSARVASSTATGAPIRASTARNPVRVGLTPTPAMRSSPAFGQHRRADQERGRRGIAGDLQLERLEPAGRGEPDPAVGLVHPVAEGAEQPLACGRASGRAAPGARPRPAGEPGQQERALDLRARHRHLVRERGQGRRPGP